VAICAAVKGVVVPKRKQNELPPGDRPESAATGASTAGVRMPPRVLPLVSVAKVPGLSLVVRSRGATGGSTPFVTQRLSCEAYRSRVVRDPRGVLAEFDFALSDEVNIQVWDANAETRYLVIPKRPPATEHLGEEDLAKFWSRAAASSGTAPLWRRATTDVMMERGLPLPVRIRVG
jgi:hypothetical protein